ncbi:MAG: hypothetical protein IPP56_16345 [Bacteroidetes bacterium]|nr:hypothetical protein [Bacteroidota bacterium]
MKKIEKLQEQRAVILDLIKPVRKKMHRIGTIKIYDIIKNDMTENNIKMGRDKLFDFLRFERMLVPKKKNYNLKWLSNPENILIENSFITRIEAFNTAPPFTHRCSLKTR